MDKTECRYCEIDKDGQHESHCLFYNPIRVVPIPDGRDLPRSKRRAFSEVVYEHTHEVKD